MSAPKWEQVEGSGQPLTLSKLIANLHSILIAHGDLPCQLRNYLEENCLAPITDCQIDGGNLVFESVDPAANDYSQMN